LKTKIFFLLFTFSFGASWAQFSQNYIFANAGAIIPTGTPASDYFGPNPYSSYGACGTGIWQWIHALCSDC